MQWNFPSALALPISVPNAFPPSAGLLFGVVRSPSLTPSVELPPSMFSHVDELLQAIGEGLDVSAKSKISDI